MYNAVQGDKNTRHAVFMLFYLDLRRLSRATLCERGQVGVLLMGNIKIIANVKIDDYFSLSFYSDVSSFSSS